jgi:colanic acid/amylovoran biosynthesis glycosyltransferase
MRIAHFVSGFPVLSETFVLDEIAAFASEGFENIIVTLRPPAMGGETLAERLQRGGWTHETLGLIEVLYPPRPLMLSGILSPRLVCLLASQMGACITHPKELTRLLYTGKRILESVPLLRGLGVVHCHAHFAHYPAEMAWGCSRLMGTTFSWNAHSYDLHLYSAHLKRRIRDADLIFPISEANRRYIEERGIESNKTRLQVCRCGIRLEEYSFGRGGETGMDPKTPLEPVLLGVGRLVDSKGFADLIRAASLLYKRGLLVKVRLIGEGPERENLQTLARSLGYESKLELLGALPRDQVREEQRRANLLVMPCCPGKNGLDGIPVVLMEAMALGTPVVATGFAAVPELVQDGISGRLVPPNQPERLADAIQDLLTGSSERDRMVSAARQKVEAEYDGPRNYREKAQQVKRLIASRKNSSI